MSAKGDVFRASAQEGRDAVNGAASDLYDVVMEMADDLDAAAAEIERLEAALDSLGPVNRG